MSRLVKFTMKNFLKKLSDMKLFNEKKCYGSKSQWDDNNLYMDRKVSVMRGD